jgi:CMP-N-acetylneuraminic acid synthetase
MNKRVAMIPVRLGSSRVPRKNIRLLGGRPLVEHIVAAAIDSGVFSEIYINSESDIFAEIAEEMCVKFYQRPAKHSTDSSTNDDFALDFMDSVPCETLFQLLATSPFITGEEIKDFVFEIIVLTWLSSIWRTKSFISSPVINGDVASN